MNLPKNLFLFVLCAVTVPAMAMDGGGDMMLAARLRGLSDQYPWTGATIRVTLPPSPTRAAVMLTAGTAGLAASGWLFFSNECPIVAEGTVQFPVCSAAAVSVFCSLYLVGKYGPHSYVYAKDAILRRVLPRDWYTPAVFIYH